MGTLVEEQAGFLVGTEELADMLSGQQVGKLKDTVVAGREKVEMLEDTGKPLVQLFEEEPGLPEDIEGPARKLLGGQRAEKLEGTVVGQVELLGHIEKLAGGVELLGRIEEPAGGVELQRHTEGPAEEAVHRLVERQPGRSARMQLETLQHILEVGELGQQADRQLADTQAVSDM